MKRGKWKKLFLSIDRRRIIPRNSIYKLRKREIQKIGQDHDQELLKIRLPKNHKK
jgi:hypothetical protein